MQVTIIKHDYSGRADSNFIQHPQSIPCSFLFYGQSMALDKKHTMYFAARSIGGAKTVCTICSIEILLCCLCCGEITSCPALQASDLQENKQLEKKNPFLHGQIKLTRAKQLALSRLTLGLAESDEVDGARRRSFTVTFPTRLVSQENRSCFIYRRPTLTLFSPYP